MKNRLMQSALVVALVGLAATPALAQDESRLKDYFEGRRVVVRLDMPGTKDGVNVYPDRRRDLDLGDYRDNMRRYGLALRAGETAMVTLVKVKKDHVEFQLNGGGFGTFWDDTDTSVSVRLVGKSDRERDLERAIKNEDDRYRRRQMERELDALRDRRDRENDRIRREAQRLSEYKQQRVAVNRYNGGSRFNVWFNGRVPYDLRPEDIMDALAGYVDFRRGY